MRIPTRKSAKAPVGVRRNGRPRLGFLALAPALLICAAAWILPGSAVAGGKIKHAVYGYFDFPTCVRYALVHSKSFLRNKIEIQLKSIDVKDSHAELVPKFTVTTRYYLTRTNESGDNRLNVNVTMSEWNPYAALLKVKAGNMFVDVAKMSHFQKITEGIAEMAKIFFRIHLLDKKIRATKYLSALRRSKVDFGQSRNEQGTVDPVSVKLWLNELRGDRLLIKTYEAEREAAVGDLKILMGYHPDFCLPLDCRNAVDQILNGFNGKLVTFADIQSLNLNLRMMAKKEQMQGVRITGAYLTIMPRPVLLVESISNTPDRTSGFNLAIGLDHTLWDGFRGVRDIKRQRMIAHQMKLERVETSRQMYASYRQLHSIVDISGEKESYKREQARLAELNEERAFTNYKSGDVTFGDYMDSRIEKVQANLGAIDILADRVNALIDLATLAGGLNRYNARIRY